MTRKVLAALAVALAIASCPVQAQPPKEVNWGYPVQSAYFWDVFAAIDFGYMAEQGLKVNPIITQNVTQQMQMLVTNAVDIVSANTELVISAIDKGADLAIIAGETARQGYALIARPEINSYSDLKGKVLGITQLREASGTACARGLPQLRDAEHLALEVRIAVDLGARDERVALPRRLAGDDREIGPLIDC